MDTQTTLFLRDLLATAIFSAFGAALTAWGLWWWGGRGK